MIDDGMLYNLSDTDPKTHPDFAGKVVGGYDFISIPRWPRMAMVAMPTRTTTAVIGITARMWAARWRRQQQRSVRGRRQLECQIGQYPCTRHGGRYGDRYPEGMLWAGGEPVAGIPNNPIRRRSSMSLGEWCLRHRSADGD